ncbi:MAG: alpha/beta hydrolase [Lachnospiraceae bacterium]|nr:alpha/beta hydrolase [Lachnospiraceae bacterium]
MEIVVDGYKISYKITGEGEETVVILQGWGTELSVYDSVAACISSQYRVVQFDLPGFGASEEPREAWDVDAYADFFLKLMDALKIRKAVLLGHSYGGRVIIKLASRENLPLEISRIVLVDSAGILPKRTWRQNMKIRRYKMLKKLVNLKLIYKICPELIDEWKSKQGSEDYRNATPMMRQCMVKAVNEDLTELLPKIRQETLLIWGDMDTATPIADAKLMEERLPDAGLAVIPGTGHFCFLEKPGQFAGIMRSYFHIG